MGDFVAFLSLILAIPVGLVLFYFLNELFDVYYFGCAGVWSTLVGCVAVGFGIILFLLNVAGFLAIPVSIICLIVWACNKNKDKNKPDE